MGEHIHGLHFGNLVFLIEQGEVACLRGGVATDIDDASGFGEEDGLHYILVHAGAGRVGDDDIGATILRDEVLVENILHVACEEESVVEKIQLRIHFRVFYCLGHILNAYHLLGLLGDEVGDGAGAGVEVEDEFLAREFGEVACYLVEFVCLLGVGLVEGLGTYLELQAFHLFHDMVGTEKDLYIEVAYGVVVLGIDYILQADYLGELAV